MNKLESVRYEAAYSQLAQKLDMHIKNFDSDPNTQIRWVWELIQNAKDAPNSFQQTKIKQHLDDFYFVSSHNGDAFQIGQLHSIVAQYSTKKQKNSELTKTTGKYGTGFITTYILSKIIELEAILKVQIDNDSDDENPEHTESDSDSQDYRSNQNSLLTKIQSERSQPSRYKNNEKLHRLIRSEIKAKSLSDHISRKMKFTQIKKKKRSRNLQRMRNQLIFEKEMDRLMIEEQMEYEEDMKLLAAQMGSLSTSDKTSSKDTDDNDFNDFEKRTNYKQKEKKPKNKKKTNHYYKKFSILMDREYTDRDEELPKKIQKTEKRLTKIVLEAEYESSKSPDPAVGNYYLKERTVDSYDTTFKYKLTDKRKFQMIETTLANVKELIPYAFLFNDTLTYYEFVDKRKGTKGNLSFSMTKGQSIQIGPNIFLFTFQVEEQYSATENRFLDQRIEYFVAYFSKGKAIAAIPVHIESNCIQILKIDPKLPKYFKDFPLIGCSDHKWNAFINSREFYPNEKRSELMLKAFDETNRSKVQTNWEKLHGCFNAVKEIYVFLSKRNNCKAGLQNLVIMSSENLLTQENVEFKVHLQKLIQEISLTKFIPNRLSKADFEASRSSLKQIYFIEMTSKGNEMYGKTLKEQYELSYEANEVFSFLYKDQNTIDSSYYKSFYSALNCRSVNREFLEKKQLVAFRSINDCLRKLEGMDLKKQIRLLCNGKHEQKLHQIYSLLQKYNQDAYLSLSKPGIFFDFKIFISENDDLRKLREDEMKFNSLPTVYEELAEKLSITIRQTMINKAFSKYVKETEPRFSFGVVNLEKLFIKKFRFQVKQNNELQNENLLKQDYIYYDKKHNQLVGLQNLKLLFSLLLTFKALKPEIVKTIKKFQDFSEVKEIKFATKKQDLKDLQPDTQNNLLSKFVEGFKVYLDFVIKGTPKVEDMLENVISIKYFEQAIDFFKDLFSDKLMGRTLCLISKKMNWQGVFVEEITLKKLKKDVEYPELPDIQVYNVGYNKRKQVFFMTLNWPQKRLQEILVHPLYPRQYLIENKISQTTYSDLYAKLRDNYNYLDDNQKMIILNYISGIDHKMKYNVKVTPTIMEKHQAWKQQIKERLDLLVKLKHANKEFDDEEVKEFLYNMISNHGELRDALLLYKNNEKKLYFTNLRESLNLKVPQPKKEEPKKE